MNGIPPLGTCARLPFDRYQRYAVAARALDVWRDGAGGLSVLEVGSNVHRDLEQFLDDMVVYLDSARPANSADSDRFVQGDGIVCPFRDRAFDVVLALDVLEHIPAAARRNFLAELLRLASRGVVIAAPFLSPAVSAREESLNTYYRDLPELAMDIATVLRRQLELVDASTSSPRERASQRDAGALPLRERDDVGRGQSGAVGQADAGPLLRQLGAGVARVAR